MRRRAAALRMAFLTSIAVCALAFQATPAGVRSHGSQRQGNGKSPVYADQLLATFTGTVRTQNGKMIRVEDADGKILEFHPTHKTEYADGDRKMKAADLKPGVRVSIDAKQFPDGELEAVSVRLMHEAPKKAEQDSDSVLKP